MPEQLLSETHDVESRLVEILSRVASTKLDSILDVEEWRRFGMSASFPEFSEQEMPSQFAWTVYVNDCEGKKYIGVKLYDANGIIDVREYTLPSQSSLPLSTKQDDIDHEMNLRSLPARQQVEDQKRENERLSEEERGFPAGTYSIFATFPHRTKGIDSLRVNSINVKPLDTKDMILKDALSWVEMAGLHNYGLAVDQKTRVAKVPFVLRREDGFEMPFECLVDASGHIIKN